MEKSKAVCPKCKGNNLLLTEVWIGSTITWEQIDGQFDKNNGSLEPGDPYKVEGRCKNCNHSWTLRAIPQIDYVIITNPQK